MKTPQEMEVWYVIPAIRKELAIALSKNLPQNKIAEKLGVAKSAISQYLSDKRGSDLKFDLSISKEIQKSADNIEKGSDFMKELQRICNIFKDKGCLCKLHKNKDMELSKNCKVCMTR